MHDHGFITRPAELQTLVDIFSAGEWVAIDTEFMREKTYFPQLCLLQLANATDLACVDPLALDDLEPLLKLLRNPNLLKVFHAAGQDLDVLRVATRVVPEPIFDTQVAASLLGHGDQISYAQLVETLLSVDLSKSQTRTDWARRPLSPEQIRYAKDDVRYLALLYQLIEQQLVRLDRHTWMPPEMAILVASANRDPDPQVLWRRISGHRRLKPQELAVLRELAAWREVTARECDLPRRWILPDDILLELARMPMPERSQISGVVGNAGKKALAKEHWDTLYAALQTGHQRPETQWPRAMEKPAPLSAEEETVIDAASALLRAIAHEQGIDPVLLGTQKDLIQLYRNPEDSGLNRGWRYLLAGQRLQDWFSGKLGIHCHNGKLDVEA